MPEFERVTEEEFGRLLAGASASLAFREQYARFTPSIYDGWSGPVFVVHRGDLVIDSDFIAPALATLVLGALTVSGYVDLCNDATRGFDEGGLFVVLGDLNCRVFCGHYGKCSFVDGDLSATDLLLNGFEDSTLVVTGQVCTRFFMGDDIWADVGAGADMAYGIGYALTFSNDGRSVGIYPHHDEAASRALLVEEFSEEDEEPTAHDLMALVRSGQPVFR